jgi:hypothetical protein
MPKHPGGHDNTEKELVELLEKVLGNFFQDMETRLRAIEHKQNTIMTALETLTDSVNNNTKGQADLTVAVNAAIVQLGTPGATDAQLLSLAQAIDSSTASDAALTQALKDAVTPPTPPTP